jgi:hypothetical protein
MTVLEAFRRQACPALDHVSRTLRWFGNRFCHTTVAASGGATVESTVAAPPRDRRDRRQRR